jgi:hypothetical protein
MNSSIIPYEEYRELLRKKQVLNFKGMIIMFLIMSIVMIGISAEMHFIENDKKWYFMLIAAGILLVICIICMFFLKTYNTKPFSPFYFEKYKNFESTETKLPMYRVVSSGKSSQTIFMILDISNDMYKLYDIGKKTEKLFLEVKTSNTCVKFYHKLKNGLEVMKPKVQFLVNGKKYNLYGYTEVNDLFVNYLRNKGLKYEVQIGRNKSI